MDIRVGEIKLRRCFGWYVFSFLFSYSCLTLWCVPMYFCGYRLQSAEVEDGGWCRDRSDLNPY